MKCFDRLGSCGPPVARWHCENGNVVVLCQKSLDGWLDNADDDESLEPAAWSWLPGMEVAS